MNFTNFSPLSYSAFGVCSLASLLCLVVATPALAKELATWPYKVQRGDTLHSIAANYLQNKNEWRQIGKTNKLKNLNRIEPNTILHIPMHLLKQETVAATIAFVEGRTELRPQGAAIGQTLGKGDKIREGDQIQTSANGSATVDFVDGSQLVILRDTIVSFTKLQGRSDAKIASIQIDLKQGRVETRVTPRNNKKSIYEIITPTVQIGVRGTEFRVNADERSLTRTEVLEGVVAAENALGSQSVPKGFGTLVEKDKAPLPPIALLPAPTVPTLLVTPTTITVHWPTLLNATKYRVFIAANQSFSQPVGEYLTSRQEVQLPPLPTGRYYLRLRGIDSNGLEGRASERFVDF
jgi:hypothetical protein